MKAAKTNYPISFLRWIAASLLLVMALFERDVLGKSLQETSTIKAPFSVNDLTYENPGCKGRWKRSDVLSWLRTHDSWIPETTLLSGDTLKEKRDSRQGLIDEFTLPGDPFVFGGAPIHGEAKPLPLQWLDIDGDGLCDFVGSYSDISMRRANQIIYVFLQRSSGFKLADYSVGEYEYSGTGITGGDPVIPVWIKGSRVPFLTEHLEFSISSDKGVVSRWNTKRKMFDNFYRPNSPTSPLQKTREAAVVKTIKKFQTQNPPKYNKALSCEEFYENAPMCANPW